MECRRGGGRAGGAAAQRVAAMETVFYLTEIASIFKNSTVILPKYGR